MDNVVEERIRALAEPLWESAAQPYEMARDFWLMAEQMVGEVFAAAGRLQLKLAEQPPPLAAGWLPDAVPVAHITELAQMMWQAAGDNVGLAQDFWLAAERHVQAMLRVRAAPSAADAASSAWVKEMAAMAPDAYLERIRTMAYHSWEAAGQQYGHALDNWLQAEQDVLGAMAAYARGAATGAVGQERGGDAGAAAAVGVTSPPTAEATAPPAAVKRRAGRSATARAEQA